MKKHFLAFCLGVPILSFANNYHMIILKENNNYISGVPDNTEEVTTPTPEPSIVDLSKQAWMSVAQNDMSTFRPFIHDGSSSGGTEYKFNLGNEEFRGDSYGFTPYDANFDSNLLLNCGSSVDEGWCSVGNLNKVIYDKTYTSGQYYFEVTAKTQTKADCVGVTINTSTTQNASEVVGACWMGNHTTGLKWKNLTDGYLDYKATGTQPADTVYQVWLDYDNQRMALMELGDNLSEYSYDSVYSNIDKNVLSFEDQAWVDMDENINLSNFKPSISDGSSSAVSDAYFNFGQDSFVGESHGFTPFDTNYDPNKWTGCNFVSKNGHDSCVVSSNLTTAHYDHSYNSGQYYFEITLGEVEASYLDSIGLTDNTRLSFYYTIGAMRTGSYENGFERGDGKGARYNYKNTGAQPSGTVFQMWIDYDNRRYAIMELNDNKSEYVDYYHIFQD